MRCSRLGDSTVPGQMAFTRMPWRMKSAARDLVRPITAAGHINDAAPFCGDHSGEEGAGGPVHGLDVEIEGEVPVLLGAIEDGALVDKACAVEEDVDGA
jgi:hypothetical protein